MKLTEQVRRQLAEGPCSGGALIEQIPVHRDAVLVYGVLARLARDGEIQTRGKGKGELLWGEPDAPAKAPRVPGPPAAFRMADEDLARIERAVWAMTEGLAGHYFEELRHAAVTRADRLAYEGAAPRRAVDRALAELGTPGPARRFLQSVEAGRHPPLRLATRRARNFLVGVALIVAVVAALRWFVVGWYRLPEGQISMAPTLVPGVEGGDEVVLANLLAYRFSAPERGDVVVFEAPGDGVPYIKRVMGLPTETIAIRQGDLFIDGERLVKDRAFLDRVKVPMLDKGFERDGGVLRLLDRVHPGFRLPDGTIEERQAPAGDVILEGTVELKDLDDSVSIFLRAQGKVRHQVILNAMGYGAGVFVENRTAVRGQPCQLEPGRRYRFWLTNADRIFRFQLDDVEIARAEIRAEPADPGFEIHGTSIGDLKLSRDLVYTSRPGAPDRWTLGADAYFFLGDNSPVSRDSRLFGAVSGRNLLGRAWRVIWPLGRARLIR